MAGIHDIAKRAGIRDEQVKALFEAIVDMVNRGGSVLIRDFGTFKAKKRMARTCHNPQDPKQKIKVPAKTVLTFSASKNMELKS